MSEKIIHLNESAIKNELKELVRNSVEETLNGLLEQEACSWSKPDADIFCEFVFDVNTAYFDENGGYEFAKKFFEEAYRMAVKEAGDERYILSAMLHADERNKGLSQAMGYDVFHYHLHVGYVPVVEKEILWSKRCKDEHLRGTVREVIHQVSRSKKWAYPEAVDEQGNPVLNKNGKPVRIPSYSLLQDRFYEHMREAGFEGFERGERGSTARHLSVLDYKIQKDTEKLARIEKQVFIQQKQLVSLVERLAVEQVVSKTFHELDGLGRKTMFGKIELPEKEYRQVIALAKEGIQSRRVIADLTQKLREAMTTIGGLRLSYNNLHEQTKEFFQAMRLAPQRVKEVFTEIFTKEREERELRRTLDRSTKKKDVRER